MTISMITSMSIVTRIIIVLIVYACLSLWCLFSQAMLCGFSKLRLRREVWPQVGNRGLPRVGALLVPSRLPSPAHFSRYDFWRYPRMAYFRRYNMFGGLTRWPISVCAIFCWVRKIKKTKGFKKTSSVKQNNNQTTLQTKAKVKAE